MTPNRAQLMHFTVTLNIVIFAGLYVLAINPYWKITPDSEVYVMAAKPLAAGDGYRVAGKPAVSGKELGRFVASIRFGHLDR